jgi:predicted phosphodiesterase
MKILALGDTHGRRDWEKVTDQPFDQLVFIGDYFDSFDKGFQEQMDNFQAICAYKRLYPDKVTLLLGNHDFHYTPLAMNFGERYSGFQRGVGRDITEALEENKDILQMAYQHGHWLLTHAGVTQIWLEAVQKDLEMQAEEGQVGDFINEVYHNSPRFFTFQGWDPYGDDPTQSPIWVRPASLLNNGLPGYNQVVGHTRQKHICTEMVAGDQYWFIDTLEGANAQAFVLEDGHPSVLNL